MIKLILGNAKKSNAKLGEFSQKITQPIEAEIQKMILPPNIVYPYLIKKFRNIN